MFKGEKIKWEVKWRDEALKSLSKLDEKTEQKIKVQVRKHLATNPTVNGYPLSGNWKGFWGYHIDDYRAIYEIIYEVKEKEILVAKVGKRTETGEPDDVYQGYHPRPTSNKRTIIERFKAGDLKKKGR